jgi:recombination protein RecA
VAEFDILYNEGISKAGDVLDLAVGLGVVEKRGSFYTHAERRLGQGREQARQALKGDPALMQELEDTVRASFKPATEPAEEAG